ncbi:hypothetical protein KL942_003354 [Ogataea angusta]|uniref:Uncharacterized protein n=1 Tax=Pichia angusta TaxID=870730 RepID=A0AAN6DGM4_PICAN|nr:uncharacterized protein KL928_003737 [Ogataea angusta]KAG7817838.1 hypothetical protein KL928_003737 [Ogataea angusta]KAG7839743.1 hypothetical protein KL942_003354 [Ogataea angusta]KAG7849376.1 hypothetical protein KL940_003058 [Ogataea angusta]
MPEEVLPYHKEDKRLAASEYEKYDPIRERFSYVIALQVFLLYIIYIYYDHINEYHPLLAGALLGAQTSCLAQSLNQFYQRTISISKHIKFYIYGIFNGAATTFWIRLLVSQVDTKLMRFVYDQTFGGLMFQFLFILYNCIWERQDLPQDGEKFPAEMHTRDPTPPQPLPRPTNIQSSSPGETDSRLEAFKKEPQGVGSFELFRLDSEILPHSS